MTDVYCPRCGEPWDIGEFHFVTLRDVANLARRLFPDDPENQARLVKSQMIIINREDGEIYVVPEHAFALFKKYGCWVFGMWCKAAEVGSPEEEWAERARLTYGMLGDDMDGAASILDEG